MSMSARSICLAALALLVGGVLMGCGSEPTPPDVGVVNPSDGATLETKRVDFQAEIPSEGGGNSDESWALRWSFGDEASATGREVTHVYDAPGTYTVSVVAQSDEGRSGAPTELTITVRNAPPIARLEADPTAGNVPLEVSLSGAASTDPDGTIDSFQWELDDGTVQTGARVAHTYREPGNYEATLTVRDADGAEARASTTIRATRAQSTRPPVTWDVRMVTTPEGRTVYDPSVLVIEPGDTVRWTTSAGRHSSTAYDAGLPEGAEAWDTGILTNAGAHMDVTFPENAPTGSYPYYCRVHQDAGMLGLIVVGEPSEIDPDFMDGLPDLLRERLEELLERARERNTEGGSS